MRFTSIALQFMETYPWLTLGNLALAMAITPVHDVLLPHLYGQLLSTIEKEQDYQSAVVFILLTITFVQLCGFVKDCLDIETQPKIYDFVRIRMMESLMDKYDGALLEPPTGLVVSTLTRSPEIIAAWVECFVDVCVPYIFAFAAAGAYFYVYDAWLSLTLVVLLASLITVLVYAPMRCIRESVEREKALQQCHEQIDDTLRNVVAVYSADTVPEELSRLRGHGVDFQEAHRKAMRCLLLYKGLGVPLVIAFFSLVIVRCCYLVSRKRISKGTFVSLFMVTTSLVNTLAWMVSLVKSTTLDTGTLAESEKMCSKAREDGEQDEALNEAPPVEVDSHGIGFSHVSYTQPGSDTPLIDDLTCHFEGGQKTLITGRVGSGKSTLLRLMMGFVVPQSGHMYKSGHSYGETGVQKVRRQIAFMPQEAVLFDRTVLENILYGNNSKGEMDVLRIMDLIGIRQEFTDMPDGIHTGCKKGGSGLSGGQKQLVFFMRVMLREPSLIILDEPTASMDTRTKRLLMRALGKMSEGKTVVMISHDPELSSFATRQLEWPVED